MWALEQQSLVDSDKTQEVPYDFNEWPEEAKQHFYDSFRLEDWEGLYW